VLNRRRTIFNKRIFLILIFYIFFVNKSESKQLSNNIIVSIDNLIITELDINKEINFIKFIKSGEININEEVLKKEAINILIDRKIKDIESSFFKIEVLEKEVENSLYNFINELKTNNENLNSFYIKHEIEKDYLRNIVRIDLKWSKLIRQLYQSRINVNMTEINKDIKKDVKNTETDERLEQNILINEQNKLLNKFSITHLEKSKKKYLIKFL
jgi:hypothetical protein